MNTEKKKVSLMNKIVSEVVSINSDSEEEVEGCLDKTKTLEKKIGEAYAWFCDKGS